jgi:hypothetical protein
VPGWALIPKRRVVERTFAWANNSRGLSKDYEITTAYEEAFFNDFSFTYLPSQAQQAMNTAAYLELYSLAEPANVRDDFQSGKEAENAVYSASTQVLR